MLRGRHPLGQLQVVRGGQERARLGDVAEARREVHRSTDVVVALEEDHRARRHSAAQLELPGASVALLDRERGTHQRLRLHSDEHQPVAEPLLHPHAEERCDLAHGGAEDLELLDGARVAVLVHEVGEPAQVDEGEGAVHPMVGGDGGELGSVHVAPLDVARGPFRAHCDNVHMRHRSRPPGIGCAAWH
ncbi:MAG: hypothetical protein ABL966_14765 [Acidimicrobiales bacterium]